MATGHRALLDGYRSRLFALFSRHAPEKVESIDEVLNNNRNREYELYCRVCRKYKTIPDARYQIRLNKPDGPRKFKPITGPKVPKRRPGARSVPQSTVGQRRVPPRVKQQMRMKAQAAAAVQVASRAPRFNLRAYRRNQAAQIMTEAQKIGAQGRQETSVRKMTRDVATQQEIELRAEMVEEFHAEVGMAKMEIQDKFEGKRVQVMRDRIQEREENLSRRDTENRADVEKKKENLTQFKKDVQAAKKQNETTAEEERLKVMQQRQAERNANLTKIDRDTKAEVKSKKEKIEMFKTEVNMTKATIQEQAEQDRLKIMNARLEERDRNLTKRDNETKADVEHKKSKIKLFQEASQEQKKSIHDQSEKARMQVLLARTEERDANLRRRDEETAGDIESKKQKIAQFQETVKDRRTEQQQYFEEQRKAANEERIKERETNLKHIEVSTKQDVARKQAKIEQFKMQVERSKSEIAEDMRKERDNVARQRLLERNENLTKRDAETEQDRTQKEYNIKNFKETIVTSKEKNQKEAQIKRLSVGARRKRERFLAQAQREDAEKKDIELKKTLITLSTEEAATVKARNLEDAIQSRDERRNLRVQERDENTEFIKVSTERDIAAKKENVTAHRDAFTEVQEKIRKENEAYRDEAHTSRIEERDRHRRKIDVSAKQDKERKREKVRAFQQETARLAREREKLRQMKLSEINSLHKSYRNANLHAIKNHASSDREAREDVVMAARQEAMRLLHRKLAALTLHNNNKKRNSIDSDLASISSADWEKRRARLEASFHSVFKRFDRNGDGLLDYKEFSQAVGVLGFMWGDEVIRDVFNQMDIQGNNCLDFQSFKIGMRLLEDGGSEGNHSANVSLPSTPEKTEFPDLPNPTPRPHTPTDSGSNRNTPGRSSVGTPGRSSADSGSNGRPRAKSRHATRSPPRLREMLGDGPKFAAGDKIVFKPGGRHSGKVGLVMEAQERGRPENPDVPVYAIQLDTGNEVREVKETRLNLVARAKSIQQRARSPLASPRASWFAPQKHKPELGDRVRCVEEINYRFGDVIVAVGALGSVACEDPLRVYWDGTDVKRGTVAREAITFVKRPRHIPIAEPADAELAHRTEQKKTATVGDKT